MMRFLTCPPPPELESHVRELWLLEDDGRMTAGLPKPQVELVVSLSGVHWWRAAPGAPEHPYAHSWITPLQRGPRYARSVGRRRLIGARLDPLAATSWFGALPPGDGGPPPHLSAFIGAQAGRLRSALLRAEGDEARFAVFGAWLSRHLPRGGRPAGAAGPPPRSARTLRRRFAREVGLSPKQWQLLRRVDAVLRDPALADPRLSLARLAQDHGYADQAHFTREIARFTRATPAALRRRPASSPPHYFPLD